MEMTLVAIDTGYKTLFLLNNTLWGFRLLNVKNFEDADILEEIYANGLNSLFSWLIEEHSEISTFIYIDAINEETKMYHKSTNFVLIDREV